MKKLLALSLPLAGLAACAGPTFDHAGLQQGAAAYQLVPAAEANQPDRAYRIGALDSVDIEVFQEPELSAKSLEVDTAGKIALPLIGDVVAVGKTSTELASEIASRFNARFLKNAQVSVTVARSVSQKVVVQGEVAQPGVYEIKGRSTLLEAISMAKGETRVAAMKQVVVFRTVEGQRMGALFDVDAIRRGEASDPLVLGSDVIVVGFSRVKSAWRDILSAAPLMSAFRPLGF
jgi:polysaccharide export outer membrane protein